MQGLITKHLFTVYDLIAWHLMELSLQIVSKYPQ